ncbi:MAG: 6-carboxytetrahydropterin synthase QueD [Actinomycetota bacterium]|nr:6-carboxytetrahydropterin synthase QueD [Actinomycetota bacterium]
MYEIRARVNFDAAHYLRDYQGPCTRMHGHTWEVEAAVAGEELGPGQLLLDFNELKEMLRDLVEPFDHRCLNEVEPFTELSPTSENLAGYMYRRLVEKLTVVRTGVNISWVSVSESSGTRVVYKEGE